MKRTVFRRNKTISISLLLIYVDKNINLYKHRQFNYNVDI